MNRAGDYIILNKNLTEQDILCGRYEGEQGIFVKRELCGDVIALFNDNYYYLNEEQFIWGENATIESVFKAFKRDNDKELIEAIKQFIVDEIEDALMINKEENIMNKYNGWEDPDWKDYWGVDDDYEPEEIEEQ